jgi:hypothetical protein
MSSDDLQSDRTTVLIPSQLRERLGRLHEQTARDSSTEPLWFTVDRALAALDHKIN